MLASAVVTTMCSVVVANAISPQTFPGKNCHSCWTTLTTSFCNRMVHHHSGQSNVRDDLAEHLSRWIGRVVDYNMPPNQ
ncbi:hypothetical protein TNCV_4371171 [Trichonephila clavipes]|nr:hypothetical protein TNCV_4371171 [Trichonephila clavipes]